MDPVWIEPVEDGVHGFQTWMLLDEQWLTSRSPKHVVCSVVVELEGTNVEESALCEGCGDGWTMETWLVESDCPPEWSQDPRWMTLEHLGLGEMPMELSEKQPGNLGVWSRIDTNDEPWLPFGWAEGAEDNSPLVVSEWKYDMPLSLQPGWIWAL